MQPTRALRVQPNLLLCLDAFNTLIKPIIPIHVEYARAATSHGIACGGEEKEQLVKAQFKKAFQGESQRNPNYGKATGLGPERWWGNVINNTFQMFLKPNQQVPPALISELLHTFSSRKGYRLYPDVKDFFDELQNPTISKRTGSLEPPWPYKKIVVGVITNSDDRISGILESLSLKVGSKRFGQTAQFTVQPAVKNDIDFVVHSYDVGHEKPDKRIFNAATSVLDELLARDGEGLTSNDFEKLYVGDDVEKDYEGATAAGWHAVLVDRNGVMRRARGFEFGQVGMRNKQGREFKVKMAKTLLHLDQWLPIKETWDKPFPRR